MIGHRAKAIVGFLEDNCDATTLCSTPLVENQTVAGEDTCTTTSQLRPYPSGFLVPKIFLKNTSGVMFHVSA
jgi:hypothetical protein